MATQKAKYLFRKRGVYYFERRVPAELLAHYSSPKIVNKKKIEAKWNANLTKAQLYAHGATDRNWFLDMIKVIRKPEMAKGYRLWMERHHAVYPLARQTNIHAKGD